MGAALPIAALAITAGGQLYGGIQENKAQRRAARDDEENARLSLKSGEQEAMDVLREALFQQGDAAATLASNGLVFGGSVSTVLADSSRAAEMDIERIREQARGEARNYYTQASERRRAGKSALIGGMFSAVATAVGGATQMRQQRQMETIAARERGVRLGGSTSLNSPSYSWRPPATHRGMPR